MKTLCLTLLLLLSGTVFAADLPNILWITSEDNGPHIGAYGDEYADTPNIDALAKRGTLYRHCWSNAPVCAPARTTIISGMYPPSLGAQHMRSEVALPEDFRMYPQYLADAGYYCTNKSKEDYNLTKRGKVWEKGGHWKNRKAGQPFFAIFNFTISHESKLRTRPHKAIHDPAGVRVPAYHPDTPEVRQDWAQYYDKVTEMDTQVGKALKELDDAGLTDDTIIFYYGDHGSGMPRSKRWPFNSGLHVPLIVVIPEKWKHLASEDYKSGGESDRLVAFVDLAPTVLSLAGLKPPKHMQGDAFLGKHEAEPNEFLHGFRGRMDERYDMVRTVTDGRYVYLRHFMPHRIFGQHVDYMFQTPTTKIWHRMYHEGKLNEAQSAFWEEKPTEQLFDLKNDPDEVVNLADDENHQETLKVFRNAMKDHVMKTRDVGFLTESMILRLPGDRTPYEYGHDSASWPLESIYDVADKATTRSFDNAEYFAKQLSAKHPASRYWAAVGFVIRPGKVSQYREALLAALKDEEPTVRVVAAEALLSSEQAAITRLAMETLVVLSNPEEADDMTALMALNVLDMQESVPKDMLARIKAYPSKSKGVRGRISGYVGRVREHLMETQGD